MANVSAMASLRSLCSGATHVYVDLASRDVTSLSRRDPLDNNNSVGSESSASIKRVLTDTMPTRNNDNNAITADFVETVHSSVITVNQT